MISFRNFVLTLLLTSSFGHHWEEFKVKYGKVYRDSEEESFRWKLLEKSLAEVAEMNAKSKSAKFEVNKFSDYTDEEKKAMLGYRPINSDAGSTQFSRTLRSDQLLRNNAPIDWRTKGMVNPQVKDQGKCGSCYSFCAIAAIESAWAIKTGKMVSLSEQDALDCSNSGSCFYGGHDMAVYIHYGMEGIGVASEECYPYIERESQCWTNTTSCQVAYLTGGYLKQLNHLDPASTLAEMEHQVANYGPIAGAISVSGFMWQYKSGVFDQCGSEDDVVNHCITIVGFTSDAWIIRNSWGSDWGDGGYMLLAKGKNACSVETFFTAPFVYVP